MISRTRSVCCKTFRKIWQLVFELLLLKWQFLPIFDICRKLFQKSSPLKPLDQLKLNLATIILRVSTFKNVSVVPDNHPTWQPWL